MYDVVRDGIERGGLGDCVAGSQLEGICRGEEKSRYDASSADTSERKEEVIEAEQQRIEGELHGSLVTGICVFTRSLCSVI